ncbi:MAG: hypothetical protein HKN90_07080 [Flavobacteriaceae bacterium]|nr:hypothetical protein [Flavobacteriaceae bacterium]
MLLVYTHKTTPRLNFTFKHFFTRILQIEIKFTTQVEKFIAHNGPKITYAKQPLGKEIFIRNHELLFEQGINDIDIRMGEWQGVPCFFMSGQGATIPFDIFAATFYLLSRYEEYLPHVKDEYERFPAEESLAFKGGFLAKPIIDIWAYKFRALLVEKFPDYRPKSRQFNCISTIDIDIAFCYKLKGIVRTFGGYIVDLMNLRIKELWMRTVVLLGFKKDPFDTYDLLIDLQKEYSIPTVFFFLVSEYTTYDKNSSSRNSKYRSLIKSVADYCKIGLHPSYFTMKNEQKLKKEKKRLEEITNRQTIASRQHYLRLALPETYQNLVNLEITEDYTMAYAKHYGFRASTCTPFYFYDLDYEIQTPLKLFPVAVMDVTLRNYQNLSHKRSYQVIMKLAQEVQHVEGTFITLFHNETLSNKGNWSRWKKVYTDMFKQLSQFS